MAKKGSASKPTTVDSPVQDAARLHIWHIQAVRDVLFVVAVIGIGWAGYALSTVTVPLLMALMLAYLFEPIIDRMCKYPKITRVWAVSGILGTVGVAVLIVLAIVIPLLITQSINLYRVFDNGELRHNVTLAIDRIPIESITKIVRPIVELLPVRPGDEQEPKTSIETDEMDDDSPDFELSIGNLSLADLESIIDTRVERTLTARTTDESENFLLSNIMPKLKPDSIFQGLGLIVQLSLLSFLIPFYFFFFSLWYPSVVRFGRGLIPEKNKRRTLDLLSKMDLVVSGFVRGRIIISLIMGLLLAIGWMICGVPHAVLLGFIVGIFCIVPYLGIVGVPLAAGFLLFDQFGIAHDSSWWWMWAILWPTVVFAIVQLIEAYVLTPMIAGKVTGLDPVTILVAVLAGGSVMGMYGMILAIPLAACGKIAFTEILLPRIRDWTEGRVADPLPIDHK